MIRALLTLLLLVVGAEAVVPGSRGFHVFKHLMDNPRTGDLALITPDIREDVMQEIYRYSFPESEQHMHSEAQTVLFRLWDENSVERLIALYKDGNNGLIGQAISDSAQPRIIPYIVGEFLREDGDVITERRDDDLTIHDTPASVYVSRVVLRLIANCDQFGSEVRSWAAGHEPSHVAYNLGPKNYRSMMREWWRDNVQFFREKNYAAVRPGRDLAPKGEALPVADVVSTANFPASPKSPPVPVAGVQQPTVESYFVEVGAVCVLLLAGLLFFWKRRT